MSKDLDEVVPVYGAFHIFSHWSTKGIEKTKNILPIAITLTILKGMWQLIRAE